MRDTAWTQISCLGHKALAGGSMKGLAVLLGSAQLLLAAQPCRVVYFELGEGGHTQNRDVPSQFVASVRARGLLTLTPSPPGTVVWEEVWGQCETQTLVVARSQFGTRIEMLGLMVGMDGTVGLAARRPATTTFKARLDQGMPGPGQAAENALRELAADLHRAAARHSHTPPPATVWRVAPAAVDGPMLAERDKVSMAAALEAMAMAVLAMDGDAVRRAPDGEVQIRAGREGAAFSLRVHAVHSWDQPQVGQGNLFPELRLALRAATRWGTEVAAARLLSSEWGPVAVLSADMAGGLVVDAGGEEVLVFDAADGSARPPPERPVERPSPPPALAPPALARYEWGHDLVLPPLRFGERVLILNRTRFARLLTPDGTVAAEHAFPDRVHAATVIAQGEAGDVVAIIDVAGRLWLWGAGQAAPRQYVELGLHPHGPLVHAPELFERWPVGGAEEDEVDVRLGETGQFLLTGSADGFVVHVRCPAGEGVP